MFFSKLFCFIFMQKKVRFPVIAFPINSLLKHNKQIIFKLKTAQGIAIERIRKDLTFF